MANFTEQNSINLKSLQVLLRQYEEAFVAGIRVDKLRPRWDFSGAFYFVGTVISTIGEFIYVIFAFRFSYQQTSVPKRELIYGNFPL